jgi:putative CocE/NonD family hydrolase
MSRITFLLSFLLLFCCTILVAQDLKDYPEQHYDKAEYQIEMRDGVKLHTTVYTPKDQSQSYPILMKRTPYSSRPYGADKFPSRLGPNKYLMQDGYIFVYQDVRGRWNSEGDYDNMRPIIADKKSDQDIDESSDTYDTVDWLIKNIKNNNGRVGQYGISYPGHYTTAGAVDAHPALKAASPQAPIGDFYFDDFHHNGAYLLSYWVATSVFGYQSEPTTTSWYTDKIPDLGTQDQYQFFLDIGPLKNLDKYYDKDNFFWQELKEHPDYDEFWQKRGIIQHLDNVRPAMMIVGGWFDAEDLYGPLMTYKTIEQQNPNTYNTIVMGPWSHGDWARDQERQAVGNVYFGDHISDHFQQNIERPFFNHFLKEEAIGSGLPEAYMYDTGRRQWTNFANWPPQEVTTQKYYFHSDENLSTEQPSSDDNTEFISDPAKPVPYSEDIKVVFTPRKFMTDDQRFAARRPDVLVFETEVLEEDVTLAGEILADLFVSTTGTDADWVVKLIDVYPPDAEDPEEMQDHLRMSNYHMMIRSEVMRGRYRNDFSKPEAFTPNEVTKVELPLQDVYHTFQRGHKIQVQIQSTWFPYIDRNPQTFVDNIFMADEEDFKKQTHTVYHSKEYPSSLQVQVLK